MADLFGKAADALRRLAQVLRKPQAVAALQGGCGRTRALLE